MRTMTRLQSACPLEIPCNWGFEVPSISSVHGARAHLTSGEVKVDFQNWQHVTWKFDNWVQSIHVDGARVSTAKVESLSAFAHNGNLRIGATHSDHDRDFEGLIDEVRIYNAALDDADIAALATAVRPDVDSDGDGQTDAEEELAGTDPNDANDAFRMTTLERTETGLQIAWASVAGRSYAIEYSESLAPEGWKVIGSAEATGDVTSFTDADARRVKNEVVY